MPGDGAVLTQRLEPVPAALDAIRAAHPDLEIHALNNTLANDEISELINSGLDTSLLLTIPMTFLILLVAFGAVVAARRPARPRVTALLAAFGILGLYSQAVAPVSPYASQLVVLIGLAVAVDYSLFMVTRFRTERRHGRTEARGDRGVQRDGRSGRLLLGPRGDDLDRRPVPARRPALPVDGGRDDLGRPRRGHRLADVPARDAGDPRRRREPAPDPDPRPGAAGGQRDLGDRRPRRDARPVISARRQRWAPDRARLPLIRLHLGQADFSSFPDIARQRPGGEPAEREVADAAPELELSVVVTRADEAATKAAIDQHDGCGVLAIPGSAVRPKTTLAADGKTAFIIYKMAGDPNDLRNQDIVRQVRYERRAGGVRRPTGVRALVTGDAAYTLDVVDFYARGMPR